MHTPNEKSLSSSRLCIGNALAAALIFSSAGAYAQAAANYVASIGPFYQFDSDLDSGGNVGYAAVFTAFRGNWTLDSHSSLGVGLEWH
jgi:hypothetical protein